ncbi:MAG: UDP-3-O-(3-hydroxymyristoyl)glucosamine N-acyltransferase [Bacteroidota bacterium]
MKFTIQQVADLLGGSVEGNPNDQVETLSKIEEGLPGSLCFLANPKYLPFIYQTKATAVIVSNEFKTDKAIIPSLIKVSDPYASYAKLLELNNQIKMPKPGVSDKASIAENVKLGTNTYVGDFTCISENAQIGNNCFIFPQVFIGSNCKIGSNTILHSGVKIYADCIIGADCTLHAGVVIGADGFGFALQNDNQSVKVAQIGNVVVEDHVEIGANSCVDRATMGSTFIRKGVKMDNQIQIGHNVDIGENTVIAAQTGVSGSTKIGKNCVIAGQVGIVGHLIIGNNVKIAGQSGVEHNLKDDSIVQGSPAFDVRKYKKDYVHFRNLITIEQRLTELEKKTNKQS